MCAFAFVVSIFLDDKNLLEQFCAKVKPMANQHQIPSMEGLPSIHSSSLVLDEHRLYIITT
jgi:hypothetical protein